MLVERKPRWALTQFRRIDSKATSLPQLGAQIADGIAKEKPKVAAQLWLERAEQLVSLGNPENYAEAVDYVIRGRDALLAAGHPRLAERHVETFRKAHRRRPQLQRALSR